MCYVDKSNFLLIHHLRSNTAYFKKRKRKRGISIFLIFPVTLCTKSLNFQLSINRARKSFLLSIVCCNAWKSQPATKWPNIYLPNSDITLQLHLLGLMQKILPSIDEIDIGEWSQNVFKYVHLRLGVSPSTLRKPLCVGIDLELIYLGRTTVHLTI